METTDHCQSCSTVSVGQTPLSTTPQATAQQQPGGVNVGSSPHATDVSIPGWTVTQQKHMEKERLLPHAAEGAGLRASRLRCRWYHSQTDVLIKIVR